MPFLSARLRLMMLCMALLGTILHAVSAILRLPKAHLRWSVQTQDVGRLTQLALHNMFSPPNIQLHFSIVDLWRYFLILSQQVPCKDFRLWQQRTSFFVLLGDAGRELTGRHTSKLVNSYFEVTEHQFIISNDFFSFFVAILSSHLNWHYYTWM